MTRFGREPSEFIEELVTLDRVSKTVKGGRIFKFAALMVVGDEKGHVDFGLGKAAEMSETIRRGIEDTKKDMCTVTLSGTITPHEVIGGFGTGHMLLRPAVPGTGIVTSGSVRVAMEAADIRNIRAKYLRSNDLQNVVSATSEGLKSLRNPEEVARIRGKSVSKIVGKGGHEHD